MALFPYSCRERCICSMWQGRQILLMFPVSILDGPRQLFVSRVSRHGDGICFLHDQFIRNLPLWWLQAVICLSSLKNSIKWFLQYSYPLPNSGGINYVFLFPRTFLFMEAMPLMRCPNGRKRPCCWIRTGLIPLTFILEFILVCSDGLETGVRLSCGLSPICIQWLKHINPLQLSLRLFVSQQSSQ